jgi:5-formyltetrahydrofolate cyclo-ligase
MEFYDFSPEKISQGSWGVMEPVQGEPVGADEIDLMIVPGVAFTPKGERMGRGKGYYDRYLGREGFRAQTIGVCYAHQLIESLPVEAHDKRVDKVFCVKLEAK